MKDDISLLIEPVDDSSEEIIPTAAPRDPKMLTQGRLPQISRAPVLQPSNSAEYILLKDGVHNNGNKAFSKQNSREENRSSGVGINSHDLMRLDGIPKPRKVTNSNVVSPQQSAESLSYELLVDRPHHGAIFIDQVSSSANSRRQ